VQAQEDGRERRYVRALVLAYLASLNRSLFAGGPAPASRSPCGPPGGWPPSLPPRLRLLVLNASVDRPAPAAKCLVEVVVEMYREGVTLEDAKLLLSLASLQQGGQLLGPMDEVRRRRWAPCRCRLVRAGGGGGGGSFGPIAVTVSPPFEALA
jgi:hypothetical protein